MDACGCVRERAEGLGVRKEDQQVNLGGGIPTIGEGAGGTPTLVSARIQILPAALLLSDSLGTRGAAHGGRVGNYHCGQVAIGPAPQTWR